jgi:hypothetical protein
MLPSLLLRILALAALEAGGVLKDDLHFAVSGRHRPEPSYNRRGLSPLRRKTLRVRSRYIFSW